MPSLTQKIPHDSAQARMILHECKLRVRESESKLSNKFKKWEEAENKALAYLPEREVDAVRRAKREGGLPEYTVIQIPYSYAVLMAAHTYLTSVFFGRNPIWQFTGRHGEAQQQVQAMEAVVDYQVIVGQMLPTLYTWLYDAGKYGVGMVGLFWENRFERVSSIDMVPQTDMLGFPVQNAKPQKILTTKTQRTYSGNRIYNIQPWDFLWDVRWPLKDFQKGEYLALRFTLGWNEVKRREVNGYYTNTEYLKGTTRSPEGMSEIFGSDQLERPASLDSSATEIVGSLGGDHPQIVTGYEVYIEIIPKEWNLSPSEYPEKWVFTVTKDFKVLLGAQPLGSMHSKFPAAVLPLEPEGYGLTTRGYPEILEPVQHTIDWLINSHFFNVRAALNNRIIVDPSRVVMKDVLNPLPGGVIRLKPEAYGTDTKLSWSQMTIGDVTQNHLRDFQTLLGVGERTVGINDQILGMLGGAGRKTATEIRTSTSFGTNRLKTTAEWFSVVGFDPLAQMIVGNTQQYYDADMKFKIAGDLMVNAGPAFIQVNPENIAGSYDFVPVDGTLPIDRFAQANLWRELMAQMRNFPQLMMGYDMVGIFDWVAQLTGLKNISRFKVQVQPDQMLLAQMQAGNVIPQGGKGMGGTSPGPQPKQMSGMGVAG